MVVLDEINIYSSFHKFFFCIAFRKETAMISENSHFDDLYVLQFCSDDFHKLNPFNYSAAMRNRYFP
ncbi:hypothetical protein SDC9_181469 [bioreactor metagenome]|uniref:Uncharacterized protein n=1 Tax=bioreactor metagenome TaxID=1076179 RepID=A0A645H4Q0_9ZZZZ